MDLLLAPPTLFALAAATALLYGMQWRSPRLRRRALDRFARKVELELPPVEARDRVEAALVGRRLAVGLAASVGTAAVATLGWLLNLPDALGGGEAASESAWVLMVAGATVAGGAAGAAWFGARQVRRTSVSPGPRMARPVAAVAADYVAPFERWSARAMGVAPMFALLTGLVIAGFVDTVAPGELLGAGTVLAALAGLAALLAAEVAVRRLVELPQVAGSPLELAWSDAVRAQLLRDVVTAPLAIGVYATFALLAAASAGVQDPVIANGLIGLIGLGIIGLAVVAVASLGSRPQRHFRRRLWPRSDAMAQDGAGR